MAFPVSWLPWFVGMALLLLSGCEPLRRDVFHPSADSGVAPQEETWEPDAGTQEADAGTCYTERFLGWDTSFAIDAQGVGHFASVQDHKPFLGTTRSGDPVESLPLDVSSVWGLEVDAQGHRHLLLRSSLTEASIYAQDLHGSWQSQLLREDYYRQRRYLAFVSAPGGTAHMLYDSGEMERYLGHGANRSGAWVMEGLGIYLTQDLPALAVDARGKAHIAYETTSAPGLHYATNASGGWAMERVDTQDGGPPAIALDAEGRPHLFYLEPGGRYIHLTKVEGSWQRTEVALGQPSATALRMDAAGTLHAVFRDSDSTLSHASNAGGSWSVTRLFRSEVSTPLVRLSFVLDARGRPVIGYEYRDGSKPFHRAARFASPGPCP